MTDYPSPELDRVFQSANRVLKMRYPNDLTATTPEATAVLAAIREELPAGYVLVEVERLRLYSEDAALCAAELLTMVPSDSETPPHE